MEMWLVQGGPRASPLSEVGSSNDYRSRHLADTPPEQKAECDAPPNWACLGPVPCPKKSARRFGRFVQIGLDRYGLQVEIHEEFVRMCTQAKRVVFFLLHLDPVIDEVLVKHVAFEQEFMVCFQRF